MGRIGDGRTFSNSKPDKSVGSSTFSPPPGLHSKKLVSDSELEKGHGSTEWGNDEVFSLSGLGLGNKQKSFREIFQAIFFSIYCLVDRTSCCLVLENFRLCLGL